MAEQSERWARDVRALLDVDATEPPAAPAGLDAKLRPYQLQGYQWLSVLWDAGLGGVLADDMGLGKTLQALALVCRAKEAGELTAPVLVVAPTSVVSNWAREAARFAPGLVVRTIEATGRKLGVPLAEAVDGADLVVTSYTLLRLGEDDYRAAAVERADPGRGAVREEPRGQDLRRRAAAAGPVQAGDHRHAGGEQPDGPVVDALDRGARAVPEPAAVHRALPDADRARRRTPRCWPRCAAGSGR